MTDQLHQSQSAAPPGGAPARAGFVRVPHHLLIGGKISANALLLWVQLQELGWAAPGYFRVSYRKLQIKCGWAAEGRSESNLNRRCWDARKELEAAGLVTTRKCRTDDAKTVPLYRLITPKTGKCPCGVEGSEHFEQLPRWVLDALTAPEAAGECSELVRHYLAHRFLLMLPKAGQRAGMRKLSVADVAQATGTGTARTRRLRAQLVALGVLFTQETRGGASALSLTPISPADGAPLPLPESESHPCRNPKVTPVGIRSQDLDTTPRQNDLDSRGSVRSTVTSVAGEHETAGKPPSQEDAHDETPQPIRGKRGDAAEQAAWKIVHALPSVQGPGLELVRYMAVAAIAHELRLTPDRDLTKTRQQILDRLTDAEACGTLEANHVPLIREGLRTYHADRKAAEAPKAERGTMLAPSVLTGGPAPESLEELSQRPAPRQPHSEADVYDWAVPWFAKLGLQALETDRDPAKALQDGLTALRRHFCDRGWWVELSSAQQLVMRSLGVRATA